jgi:ubiquinone/menaquinone biosynthesis C-methylase UbiE
MKGLSRANQNEFTTLPDEKVRVPQEFDLLMAEQYRRVYLDLVKRWSYPTADQRILKTDLYAEARCMPRAFLLDILKTNKNAIGIDISIAVTQTAQNNLNQNGYHSYIESINCDVRHLPFQANQFDLIISDSTLDHFHNGEDIVTALKELHRVLAPGGTLIISLDNKGNITEPLFRLWIKLGLAPYFIGVTYNIRELKTQLARTGFQIEDETAIIHNPRFFTKMFIKMCRRMNARKYESVIKRMLGACDKLENSKIKYLTAQFVAVKAKKIASR